MLKRVIKEEIRAVAINSRKTAATYKSHVDLHPLLQLLLKQQLVTFVKFTSNVLKVTTS